MFPLGLGILFLGIWLVDSGYKNRAPLTALKAVISDPAHFRATLAGSSGTVPSADGATAPSALAVGQESGGQSFSTAGIAAVAFARAQIGKPYVFGATGPNSFDCSGLVRAAFKNAGVDLPRTTFQQITSGVAVSKAELRLGDLVFADPGHVALYSGNGNVIEAPHSGAVVREVAMWGFWKGRRV